MSPFLSATLVLIAAMFGSRLIQDSANRKLENDKKALLVDLFSKNRTALLGSLFLIIGLFLLNTQYGWIDDGLAFFAYISLILLFITITSINAYGKLKVNAFPMNYIRAFLIATAIRVLGMMAFFAVLTK